MSPTSHHYLARLAAHDRQQLINQRRLTAEQLGISSPDVARLGALIDLADSALQELAQLREQAAPARFHCDECGAMWLPAHGATPTECPHCSSDAIHSVDQQEAA